MHLRTVLEGHFLESPCVILMGVQHFCSVGIGGGEAGDGGGGESDSLKCMSQ